MVAEDVLHAAADLQTYRKALARMHEVNAEIDRLHAENGQLQQAAMDAEARLAELLHPEDFKDELGHYPHPMPVMVLLNEGTMDEYLCTVESFVQANESLDEEEINAVRSLQPGDTYRGGGGAAAEWTITNQGRYGS